MTTVNKKLIQEVESPFHSYLLFSNFSSELVKQAKMFAMLLAFDSKDYAEHPDIKIIDSENLNTLGVEDIRDVINKDSLSPIEGKYKVVIFPPVKSLTEEASNALLKTIEEPSSRSIFIILSSGKFWSHARDDSQNSILSTIKSRLDEDDVLMLSGVLEDPIWREEDTEDIDLESLDEPSPDGWASVDDPMLEEEDD